MDEGANEMKKFWVVLFLMAFLIVSCGVTGTKRIEGDPQTPLSELKSQTIEIKEQSKALENIRTNSMINVESFRFIANNIERIAVSLEEIAAKK